MSEHKYLGIDDKDNEEREPEGAKRRENCICVVLADKAGVRILTLSSGPPAEQRSAGDESRGEPCGGQENDADCPARQQSGMGVADIACDEPVAVKCYDHDIENRCRATEHVGRYPQVADGLTECPAPSHLVLSTHAHTQLQLAPLVSHKTCITV